ncbi:hypothetical protein CCY99_02640 [Helicobacter sp. 16-1353]|uniref:TatD family hydrolase n=1 Tax=Helicobacter sp. 16-1353 TaxID=2004996 RepID=UPI000DCD09BC|nr:TatD family hydrolase [Helicobacter sp. 16-1353]RAX54678.1 hypothetical protein CCY99_02640 [Helicobacter sp. 16-1353]
MYIDTHCHLDSKEYINNLDSVITNAIDLGLERIVIPGANINDLQYAIDISEKYDIVYFASGIHPSEIENLNEDSKSILKNALSHSKCVAIGEIGLDYHYLDSNPSIANDTKAKQKIAFRYQIELALENSKPIIIHTRDSNDDVKAILSDYANELNAVIFHCFGGDMNLFGFLKCPCYYGIGGIVSFKNAHSLRESLKEIPLESLLLETDAPYLSPTPHRGKTNTPEYIPLIASHLANTLQMDINKLAAITTMNAKSVFRF